MRIVLKGRGSSRTYGWVFSNMALVQSVIKGICLNLFEKVCSCSSIGIRSSSSSHVGKVKIFSVIARFWLFWSVLLWKRSLFLLSNVSWMGIYEWLEICGIVGCIEYVHLIFELFLIHWSSILEHKRSVDFAMTFFCSFSLWPPCWCWDYWLIEHFILHEWVVQRFIIKSIYSWIV